MCDETPNELLKQAGVDEMVALRGRTDYPVRTQLAESIICILAKNSLTESVCAYVGGISEIAAYVQGVIEFPIEFCALVKGGIARHVSVSRALSASSSRQFVSLMLRNASLSSDTMNSIMYELILRSEDPLQHVCLEIKVKTSDMERFLAMEGEELAMDMA